MSNETTVFHSPPQEYCAEQGCGCALPPPPDADVAADVAALISDRIGEAMRYRLEGMDLPLAVNSGSGDLAGVAAYRAVIDLDDGRRVTATVTVSRPDERENIYEYLLHGDVHRHTYLGQSLRHSHPDGRVPHGYFGHPEDGGRS